ncbi:MAG: LysR family transcriptional regulator [Pseudomonadota bacterium]
MEQSIALDDLALFVAVADAGGLAGAARASGTSVPTLSRRMARLESAIGRKLFERGARGYSLTGAGRALLAEIEGVREISAKARRFAARRRDVPVRITAGHWTSMYLARDLPAHLQRDGGWRPEFVTASAYVDIARREADIGIRLRRPDQPWLAGRRMREVEFAPFGRSSAATGFIGQSEETPSTRSEAWLRDQHPDQIVATVSTPRLACDLAIGGLGQVILPRFIAPLFPELVQTGPTIAALTQHEWLVSHHDARHDPPIRAALDAIGALLAR